MTVLGDQIRKLRKERKLSLKGVSDAMIIDQAILSKIELGQRKANRDQVLKFAEYFGIEKDELLVNWLADKLIYDVQDEDVALKALKLAEQSVSYLAFKKISRNEIRLLIVNVLSKFKKIRKAWIYGSFSREDDSPKSDIDIALETDEDFSYFDLAEVQFELEKVVPRKVDVGFLDSFKPYIFENVKSDLKLIYERNS